MKKIHHEYFHVLVVESNGPDLSDILNLHIHKTSHIVLAARFSPPCVLALTDSSVHVSLFIHISARPRSLHKLTYIAGPSPLFITETYEHSVFEFFSANVYL